MMKQTLAVGCAALLAVACTTTEQSTGRQTRNNTATGAIVGAGLGALAGVLAGGDDRRNAVIGAGIGAIAGAGVGVYMDRQQKRLEQELSGSGVGIRREGDNIYLVMPSDVTFATNQASITPDFYSVLDDVAAVFAEYPSTYVDVYGHADATGSDAYNQELSQKRAYSVANYLQSRGVQPERFYVQGFGESRPIADNNTEFGRAQNRRVEIVLRPVTA